jgi:hypothetical protein
LAEAAPSGGGYPLRLALPVAETALLCGAYAEARVILEYGAGGSTLIAGQVPGARVFAVDSDAAWIARLSSHFATHPPEAPVVLHHADIGPVRDWGHPADRSGRDRWPGYAAGVWERPDFVAPDVVFIDGRFRLACFLTVLLRSQDIVTVLWRGSRSGRRCRAKVRRPCWRNADTTPPEGRPPVREGGGPKE